MNDNCLNCMYSRYSDTSLLLDELLTEVNLQESQHTTCNHLNSPYFNEIVSDETSCRLFVDEHKYFMLKDRKDKIDKLNSNDLDY